jgi:hypothetical protein
MADRLDYGAVEHGSSKFGDDCDISLNVETFRSKYMKAIVGTCAAAAVSVGLVVLSTSSDSRCVSSSIF